MALSMTALFENLSAFLFLPPINKKKEEQKTFSHLTQPRPLFLLLFNSLLYL
jgi:hypothetical protein